MKIAFLKLASLGACLFLCSCLESNQYSQFTGKIMGTGFLVHVQDIESVDEQKLVVSAFESVNSKMSTYNHNTELSRFNRSESLDPFSVSAETFEVLEKAFEIYNKSDGMFDVTVGPLVNAYGFGYKKLESPPTQKQLDEMQSYVGMQFLNIANVSIQKKHPKVEVDLSAIAKGYAVDLAAQNLLQAGVRNFMIELGGEIRVQGLNQEGEAWRIAIEKPEKSQKRSIQRVLEILDLSMATSGNYRNFYEKDGVEYTHTMDPVLRKTQLHKLASVSVFHPSCAIADAWATAFMALGEDRGKEIAIKEGISALFMIRSDGELEYYESPAFRKTFGE